MAKQSKAVLIHHVFRYLVLMQRKYKLIKGLAIILADH